MEMSSALIYSLRYIDKLSLNETILKNISKLRLLPAAYRPARYSRPRTQREDSSNWREKVMVELVRRVREVEDADYDIIFSIFNKVGAPNLDVLSAQAIQILKNRDQEFRLRVTTLLFDKAIKGSVYAETMSSLALKLDAEIPEISEDLEIQAKMFTVLYNMSETLTFPSADDPEFDGKVISWFKQKDIRRGYSRFLTHLYIKNLIQGNILHDSMQKVLNDLDETVVQPRTQQTEENVTQYADFLFEIAKILPKTAVEMRGLIQTRVNFILTRSRSELLSLNMRSRFKLEDTFKCVQVS
jgi:hypothetical protein